ncbi:hypothetical protein D3C83_136360 [compost metagenome]
MELLESQRRLVERVLSSGPADSALEKFRREHAVSLKAIDETAREIDAEEPLTFPALAVLAQMIRRLCTTAA